MTVETWSYLAYGLWFLIWVALEVTGYAHKSSRVPWFTLSETAWALQKRFKGPARVILFAGLSILLVHICFGFPGAYPVP